MDNILLNRITERLFQRLDELGITTPALKEDLESKIRENPGKNFEHRFIKVYGLFKSIGCMLPVEWDHFFNAYTIRQYEVSAWPQSVSIPAAGPGSLKLRTAFYGVTGKIDKLVEQFRKKGFLKDKREIEQCIRSVTGQLDHSPTGFVQKFMRRFEYGTLVCKLPVEEKDGNFKIKEIEASFIIHPNITHGVYKMLSSWKLEGMLRAVNWFDDSYMHRDPDGQPVLSGYIIDIVERLDTIEGDPKGKITAEQLKNKYWPEGSFMRHTYSPRESVEVTAHLPASLNLMEVKAQMQEIAKSKKLIVPTKSKRKNGLQL